MTQAAVRKKTSAMSLRAYVAQRTHSGEVAKMSAASSPTRQCQRAWPKKNVTSTVAVANTAEGERTANSLSRPLSSAMSAPHQ